MAMKNIFDNISSNPDLLLASLVMLVLALLAGYGVYRFARRVGGAVKSSLAVVLVSASLVFTYSIADSTLLIRLLPLETVMVCGNILPFILAALAAVMWSQENRPARRRLLFTVPLLLLAAYSLLSWTAVEPPEAGNRWDGKTCLQTTSSTCGAAAAATIPFAHDE
jgi:hypothetical protein